MTASRSYRARHPAIATYMLRASTATYAHDELPGSTWYAVSRQIIATAGVGMTDRQLRYYNALIRTSHDTPMHTQLHTCGHARTRTRVTSLCVCKPRGTRMPSKAAGKWMECAKGPSSQCGRRLFRCQPVQSMAAKHNYIGQQLKMHVGQSTEARMGSLLFSRPDDCRRPTSYIG